MDFKQTMEKIAEKEFDCEFQAVRYMINQWGMVANELQKRDSLTGELSIPIAYLSREDIDRLGYDSSKIKDSELYRIRDKIGDAIMDTYWEALEIYLEENFGRDYQS